MTIDEEIKHQEEISDRYARMSEYEGNEGNEGIAKDCAQCAADHAQLAEWLTELKEARKLLTATKYKVEHEEWDMHGEHYIGDYALCPNCDKCFTNIYNGKAAPVVAFCPDCGQKIDWS